MNGGWSAGQLVAGLAAAAFLFLMEMTFSVVLVSVSALSRVALHRMATNGNPRLAFLTEMRGFPSKHRMATAMARQGCLLGGALVVGWTARGAGWGHPEIAGTLAAALVGVVVLEFALARVVALWDPRAALRHTAFLVHGTYLLLSPVVVPLHALLGRLARFQAPTEEEREEEMEEEVEAYIEVGERAGILEAEEGEMMRSIVDLDETRVREIMTPRPDVVSLPVETTITAARKAVLDAGHSRVPVYRDTIDNVVGLLHVRDLLKAWEEGDPPDQTIGKYLREPMFVPEPLSVANLLSEMRVKTHMAIVVDEYGGVAGLVTLEDLLEEIVGDIRDEHDLEETPIREEADGSWVINAATHVDELEDLFGVEFEDRDFDTVGGLIVSQLGRVPDEGETVETRNLRITVMRADRRRVHEVRVRPIHPTGEAEAGA